MEPTQHNPEFVEWEKKNPWFKVDTDKRNIYLGIAIGLRYLKAPITGHKFMAAVDAAYREYENTLLAEGNKPKPTK